MSTYYALYCERCRQQADFVSGMGAPSGRMSFTWMDEAITKVPRFLEWHQGHFGALVIISETDNAYHGSRTEEEDDRQST